MNWDPAVSWGRGVWVSVSDIGRVGSGWPTGIETYPLMALYFLDWVRTPEAWKKRQIFYVPGQRPGTAVLEFKRAKPAKVLEPPLFGSRRGGLHANWKTTFLFLFNYVCLFSFHFFSRTLCTAVPVSLITIPPCSSGNKVAFEPAQSDAVFIRRHMSHLYEGNGTRQSKQASSPPVWKSFDKFILWKWWAHVLYKTILSEQCLQYTKKSSRKRLQPLGKKNINSALHVEPFNTATKLYSSLFLSAHR